MLDFSDLVIHGDITLPFPVVVRCGIAIDHLGHGTGDQISEVTAESYMLDDVILNQKLQIILHLLLVLQVVLQQIMSHSDFSQCEEGLWNLGLVVVTFT
jgi:hypothetical protein